MLQNCMGAQDGRAEVHVDVQGRRAPVDDASLGGSRFRCSLHPRRRGVPQGREHDHGHTRLIAVNGSMDLPVKGITDNLCLHCTKPSCKHN